VEAEQLLYYCHCRFPFLSAQPASSLYVSDIGQLEERVYAVLHYNKVAYFPLSWKMWLILMDKFGHIDERSVVAVENAKKLWYPFRIIE